MQKGLYLESCYMCTCENGKSLASNIGDSRITCNKITNAADSQQNYQQMLRLLRQ